MSISKRKIRVFAALLLTLFSWYWCSVTLFSHEHFVDGERIMHSHPLTGSSHSHTSTQLQTISFLAMFVALAIPVGFVLCVFDGFLSEIAINLTESITTRDTYSYLLRAPPASLL